MRTRFHGTESHDLRYSGWCVPGRFTRLNGRIWFRKADVDREAQRREHQVGRWISYADAATIVGCSHGTIGAAVRRGDIANRPASTGRRGGRASLDASSVRAFAANWATQRAHVAAEAAERAARRSNTQPPDDQQVWLNTYVTALVVGVSPSRVKQLAAADRPPHVRIGRRLWFRRQDIEQAAAVRAFRAAKAAATADTDERAR